MLWHCNIVLPAAAETLGLPAQVGGSWLEGQIDALTPQSGAGALELTVLAPSPKAAQPLRGQKDGGTYMALPAMADGRIVGGQAALDAVLKEVAPDVVHIFGTEYAHNLAMLQAAGPQRSVVSLQGLVGYIARHYTDGLPNRYRRRSPIKMLMKRLYAAGVVADEQRAFAERGADEAAMLQSAAHVIGRTGWDRACLYLQNPAARYYHCDEVLRAPFYGARQWRYDTCEKQSIFLSQAYYPVKGAHTLLEQLPAILERWPSAEVMIAGQKPYSLKGGAVQGVVDYFFEYQGYLKKLCRRLGVENRIHWLGPLSAEEMKAAYLRANVFVNPSSIENSPNSLAEAMALGLPVVASNVGGVGGMLQTGREGFLYPSREAYLLPYYIGEIFAAPRQAAEMGARARRRALQAHDPWRITDTLMAIYSEVAAP